MTKTTFGEKGLVFQLNWPVSSYTRDLINVLTEDGCRMHFVTTRRSVIPYMDISQIQAKTTVLLDMHPRAYQLFWAMWKAFSVAISFVWPVDPLLCRAIGTHIMERDYDFVIAIEKESLLVAMWLFKGTKTKVFYWSLELYNEGHPSYFKYRNLNVHARREYKFLSGFFIQDQLRWAIIKRECDIDVRPFYLPICSNGPIVSVDKRAVRRKYGINENSIVLLAHGNISDERGLADIIELSRHLHDDIIIVLHGKLLQRILKNLPMNVFMRNEVLSEDDLMEYIAMADIGLAIYNDISENNKYVAFSSHKIAIYSRCGLPYIAYHNESFEVLNEMIVWGVTVNNVNEITKAIDHIMTNYTFYQKQTQLAYEGIYCFDKYRETLIEYITN